MMDAPKKTIQWKPGDTVVRWVDMSDDRVVPVLFFCAWLFLGWWGFFRDGAVQVDSHFSPFTSSILVPFSLWLIVLVLICLLITCVFFGSIKISISAEELIIRHCLDGQPISASAPINLSTIVEVSVEESVYKIKGGTVHAWLVLARSDAGETHRVATFYDEVNANELMRKLVCVEY